MSDEHRGSVEDSLRRLLAEKEALEARVLRLANAEESARREKEFSDAILNAIDDAISIIHVPDLSITHANDAFAREYRSAREDLIGRACYEVTHARSSPCEAPDHDCPLWEAVRTSSRVTVEHVHSRPDGERFFAEITVYPIHDEQGTVFQVVHATRDITERKNAERQLAERAEALAAANESLSQYAHVVSHDLRAPLRAIRQYADFLREDLAELEDGPVGEHLDGLDESVTGAEELVTGLLSLTRIGKQSLALETVDLRALAIEIIDSTPLPGDVEVRIDDRLPVVEADRLLLTQVMQNLVTNAVKFNESSPKVVEIGLHRADGSEWTLFVRDNGIGMEERFHERVFEAFERLHSDDAYAGTGLGLAIVKKAMRKMGGAVRLESALGEGATFFVTLPVP